MGECARSPLRTLQQDQPDPACHILQCSADGRVLTARETCRVCRARRRAPRFALYGSRALLLEKPSEFWRNSLRELAKSIAPLAHELARMGHLFLNLRIIRRNAQALRRLGQEHSVPFAQLYAFQHVIRKDDPDRFAQLPYLQTDHGALALHLDSSLDSAQNHRSNSPKLASSSSRCPSGAGSSASCSSTHVFGWWM